MSLYKDRKLQFSNHPQWPSVLKIVKTLQEKGYETLLAGGAVRDALLGKMALDLDIATKAEPDQVEALFPHTVAVGKAFGVIRVIDQGHSIEVATFRLDQNYKDGRRPESVIFTSREEDAKRRDFTVNALFYDVLTETLYDDVQGLPDLDQKILRAVGEPHKRFQEDELRRLRLIRFVSQLGFQIEPVTWNAVKDGVEGLQKISRERITEEIFKTWKGKYLRAALPLWLESSLAVQVDPLWSLVKIEDIPTAAWSWSRENAEEIWAHYFSFFWQKRVDWESSMKQYRLSRELQQALLSGFKCFSLGHEVLNRSWGEQRLLAAEPLAIWAFQVVFDLRGDKDSSQAWQALKQRLVQAGELPQPLIRGFDLKNQYQGAQLGDVLKQLYREQLNQGWTRPDQALEWLSQQK